MYVCGGNLGCLLFETSLLSDVFLLLNRHKKSNMGSTFYVFGVGDPQNINLKVLNHVNARTSIEACRLSHQA